jgi:uncharacterized protein YdhG (YjbR/CyaY superfamily)
MPFRPGAGAGGHCIPVDPVYLLKWSDRFEFKFNLLENAIKINLEGKNYRELLMKKLENEGYIITPIAPGDKESIEALKDELASYTVSKGTIQFTLDHPLPDDLIEKLLKARITAIEKGKQS